VSLNRQDFPPHLDNNAPGPGKMIGRHCGALPQLALPHRLRQNPAHAHQPYRAAAASWLQPRPTMIRPLIDD
jgi:hypothetical protein